MIEIFDPKGHYGQMFRRLSQKSPLNTMTFEEICAVHDYIIDQYGGLSGMRDESVLHSIVDAVSNLEEYYDSGELSLYDLAATYLWNIALFHPFSDGNKRSAVATALLFLNDNGVTVKFDTVMLEQLAKACATSEFLDDVFYGEGRYTFSLGDARACMKALIS